MTSLTDKMEGLMRDTPNEFDLGSERSTPKIIRDNGFNQGVDASTILYKDAEKIFALTAEREAGAREERERVHKFVRKDFHSDFVENGLATRFYQALTPPTK